MKDLDFSGLEAGISRVIDRVIKLEKGLRHGASLLRAMRNWEGVQPRVYQELVDIADELDAAAARPGGAR